MDFLHQHIISTLQLIAAKSSSNMYFTLRILRFILVWNRWLSKSLQRIQKLMLNWFTNLLNGKFQRTCILGFRKIPRNLQVWLKNYDLLIFFKGGEYSTSRNSSAKISEWREKIGEEEKFLIESICEDYLKSLNYNL